MSRDSSLVGEAKEFTAHEKYFEAGDLDAVPSNVAAAPKEILVIEFCRSSSPNYKVAEGIARKCSRYTSSGEGKFINHRCDIDLGDGADIGRALKLLRIVSGWKTTSVLVESDLRTGWEVQRVLECFQSKQRKRAHNQSTHCLPYGEELRVFQERYDYGSRFNRREDILRIPCSALFRSSAEVEWWRLGVCAAEHEDLGLIGI